MTAEIRPEELAERWGCSPRRLRKVARDLGACRVLGKAMWLTADDVQVIQRAMFPERAAAEEQAARIAHLEAERRRLWLARSRHPDTQGTIYFVASEGMRVKIGFTRSLKRRLRDLRQASSYELLVLATVPGTLRDEQEFHRRFAMSRLHGEWFVLTDKIMAYIEALRGRK